jgi:transglutaminase-like putative cysteine protease
MADITTTATVIDSNQTTQFQSGMKLAVLHRTVFHYGIPASNSVNTLHLEPRTFPYQKTISVLIRVIPATRLRRFTDLFQNITHHFELPTEHSRLEVESRLKVHNLPLDISLASRQATAESYEDPSIRERIWPYLQESRWVSFTPDIWRQALDISHSTKPIFEQAVALMDWIYRKFTYEPGVTNVETHSEDVFKIKKGVCQDFTHVMLALCRSIGIPARYASGYLYNGHLGTLVGAQASHAWSEIYIAEAGWIGFDPTNNNLADERYVKVAVGRDYQDVSPIRGNYQGGGHCRMEIQVEVEQI